RHIFGLQHLMPLAAATLIALAGLAEAGEAVVRSPLAVEADDVVPTGNDWLSLPDIRAADGAVASFTVLSKAYRGLLRARGPGDGVVADAVAPLPGGGAGGAGGQPNQEQRVRELVGDALI
ncbi:hypothetical protein J8J40_23940, partial [Mycobacterium tuberculosis]|nr:hypothetical protein [Mycobacterium tuberculosis]